MGREKKHSIMEFRTTWHTIQLFKFIQVLVFFFFFKKNKKKETKKERKTGVQSNFFFLKKSKTPHGTNRQTYFFLKKKLLIPITTHTFLKKGTPNCDSGDGGSGLGGGGWGGDRGRVFGGVAGRGEHQLPVMLVRILRILERK